MHPSFVCRLLVGSIVCAASNAYAAELAATGISMPFFNAAGSLTHRILAKTGVKSGQLQKLHGIEVHYFAVNNPTVIVQKIEAQDATWDNRKETLVGQGSIVVATVENRMTGEGFDFALKTAVLQIHRSFTMTNADVELTSDRATIELIVEQSADELKVRDLKRCEAIGNLHIVTNPAAQGKFRFKEAFSDVAIYDGMTRMISLPRPTRTIQPDGGEGRFNTLTIDLKNQTKK